MANCTNLFQDYIKTITPTSDQLDTMRRSREQLEDKIIEIFQEKLDMTVSFYTQGSGAKGMRTMIIKENGTYDADRGVYLPQNPDMAPETIQKYVLEAVEDHTDDGAEHRKKCIRVFYKCAYNIDFPVYYEVPDESYSYLAVKGGGWIKDDPAKMVEWFCQNKDEDGQLIRMVKCLKGWASKSSFKMPSGIALTVWSVRNFVAIKDRDDECLFGLLKAMKLLLMSSVACASPVEPFDDLTSKLNDDQKSRFQEKLAAFCSDAETAISSKNQLEASKLWRKHLGERFPLGEDQDVDRKASLLMANADLVLANRAKLDRQGRINSSTGVAHKEHRNHGA